MNEALERAQARLHGLLVDPQRLPRHALKVLVKYLMLDLERVEVARFVEHLAAAPVLSAAAGQLGLPAEQALRRTIDELVRDGRLAIDDEWLLDRPD